MTDVLETEDGAIIEDGAPGEPVTISVEPVPAAPVDDGLSSLSPSWQAEVKKLRSEGQGLRERLKADPFNGWDDPAAELVRGFVTKVREDPAAALRDLISQGYGAAEAKELLDDVFNPPAPDEATEAAPLTQADLDRILTERDQAAAQERYISETQTEAKGLGYHPDAALGTEEAFAYQRMLSIAAGNGGDIKAAHDTFEAEKAAAVKAWRDAAVARGAAHPAPGNGQAAPGGQVDTSKLSMKEADAMAARMITAARTS